MNAINHPSYRNDCIGNWAVDTGDGCQLTAGVDERTARKVALEDKERTGDEADVYEMGASDGEE